MVQTADSSLGAVVSSLTQAVSLGTPGANGTNSTSDLQAIAEQVQGIPTQCRVAGQRVVSGFLSLRRNGNYGNGSFHGKREDRRRAISTTATRTRTRSRWVTT